MVYRLIIFLLAIVSNFTADFRSASWTQFPGRFIGTESVRMLSDSTGLTFATSSGTPVLVLTSGGLSLNLTSLASLVQTSRVQMLTNTQGVTLQDTSAGSVWVSTSGGTNFTQPMTATYGTISEFRATNVTASIAHLHQATAVTLYGSNAAITRATFSDHVHLDTVQAISAARGVTVSNASNSPMLVLTDNAVVPLPILYLSASANSQHGVRIINYNTGSTSTHAHFWAEAGNVRSRFVSVHSDAGYIGTDSNHVFYFYTNNTTRAKLDTNGRFGVGYGTGGLNSILCGRSTAVSQLELSYNSSNAVNFNVNSSGYLGIDGNGGRVGIETNSPTEALDINSDTIRIRTSKTPASSSDTCDQGEVVWDSSYIYVCTATNTWRRSTLAAF